MKVDADRLAQQVKLAYEFMEALHGQALALIKDVETQLVRAPEQLECLRPGGYRYTLNPLSYTLERPQAILADYYGLWFRYFEGNAIRTQTPLDGNIPPIAFLKVVLRERNLVHPEVRFGIVDKVIKIADSKWPKKFEDVHSRVADLALVGPPPWIERRNVKEDYKDSYISLEFRGVGIRLADLPDSEAIAEKVVDPLLEMYRQVATEA